MGREIAYTCDVCGSDCTHNFYTVQILHRADGNFESLISTRTQDYPILCHDCFSSHFSSFIYDVEGNFVKEENGEEYDEF